MEDGSAWPSYRAKRCYVGSAVLQCLFESHLIPSLTKYANEVEVLGAVNPGVHLFVFTVGEAGH